MTQEERQKQSVVKTTSIVAAGCASVVAALFTSKLGVAGTLVGTAMTSMVITLTSAILNSQLERASTKISGLPSTVRGRLSTQQVRVPSRPNADPNPEPPEPEEESGAEPLRRSDQDGRSAGFLQRLRSVPDRLRTMSPATRRRVLISGAVAGIAATAIGLSIITFTEAAAGENFSSLVWSQNGTTSGGSGGGGDAPSGTSVEGLFGGSSGTNAGDQQYTPSGGGSPGAGDQQYPQQPAQPGAGGVQQPQDPAQQPIPQAPQGQDPAQQPIPSPDR